jgi:acylphosphatase
MNETARHIIFIGGVEGVGFGFEVLTGWVRNLADGTVEMVAQGATDDMNACIRDIKESFDGYIRETRTQEIPPEPQYIDFKITF